RLPNQAYLMRDIGQRLDQGRPLALIFTNLLNLKRINDGLGFESGDALIIQAARRLDEVVDKPGLLAHLGGGQYIVKLDTNNVAAIEGQIARIFGCFKLPYRVGSEQISQNVSVGVVRSPEDGGTAHELLSRAHVAANQ